MRRKAEPARRAGIDRERRRPALAGEGGEDGVGRRGPPYDGVAQLTATPEAERVNPETAPGHAPWIRPIAEYERRETTVVEGLRYG